MAASTALLLLAATAVAADYGDPRKGACATGDSEPLPSSAHQLSSSQVPTALCSLSSLTLRLTAPVLRPAPSSAGQVPLRWLHVHAQGEPSLLIHPLPSFFVSAKTEDSSEPDKDCAYRSAPPASAPPRLAAPRPSRPASSPPPASRRRTTAASAVRTARPVRPAPPARCPPGSAPSRTRWASRTRTTSRLARWTSSWSRRGSWSRSRSRPRPKGSARTARPTTAARRASTARAASVRATARRRPRASCRRQAASARARLHRNYTQTPAPRALLTRGVSESSAVVPVAARRRAWTCCTCSATR